MAVNTLRILEKLGFRHREIAADADTDIGAIVQFLKDTHYDTGSLLKLFASLRELRREAAHLTDEDARRGNLRAQIELFDELLLRYEGYDQDVEINGIRVKKIARQFIEEARNAKLYALLDKIKKDPRWVFDW